LPSVEFVLDGLIRPSSTPVQSLVNDRNVASRSARWPVTHPVWLSGHTSGTLTWSKPWLRKIAAQFAHQHTEAE
jgi:hypothetical protein